MIRRCKDCRQIKRHYAKGLCKACYVYQRKHGGKKRKINRTWAPLNPVHCHACLELFQQKAWTKKQRCCSHACRGLLIRYQHYRIREEECQRCHRVRKIRAKKLCAPCYVYSRFALNRDGIYGHCSSKIDRLKIA